MYEELLLDSGLTQNEIKAYLTLLKLGKSQSGKIVQESKISSGKIYETLSKLLEKGLIEISVENGIKQFVASNPESLSLYMKEKRDKLDQKAQELEKIIPELNQLRSFGQEMEGVFLVKGFRGIKPLVYELFAKTTGEFLVMGVRSSKNQKFNTFWTHWHNERVRRGRKSRLLFTDRDTEYWRFFQRLKLTKCKSVTSLSPSAVMVVNDNTFIFSYQEELTCVHIISAAIAQSVASFFDSMWKIARY